MLSYFYIFHINIQLLLCHYQHVQLVLRRYPQVQLLLRHSLCHLHHKPIMPMTVNFDHSFLRYLISFTSFILLVTFASFLINYFHVVSLQIYIIFTNIYLHLRRMCQLIVLYFYFNYRYSCHFHQNLIAFVSFVPIDI